MQKTDDQSCDQRSQRQQNQTFILQKPQVSQNQKDGERIFKNIIKLRVIFAPPRSKSP